MFGVALFSNGLCFKQTLKDIHAVLNVLQPSFIRYVYGFRSSATLVRTSDDIAVSESYEMIRFNFISRARSSSLQSFQMIILAAAFQLLLRCCAIKSVQNSLEV